MKPVELITNNEVDPAKAGIYMIYCLTTEKVYIGQTKKLKTRLTNHKRKLNNNIHENEYLQNAWNKYGKACFNFILLENCEVFELNKREEHHISLINIDLRYNLKTVGNSHPMNEEIKKKISKSMKGVVHSAESIQKQIETKKKNPTIYTEETRKKMSDSAKKRKPISEETRRRMSVAQKGRKHTDETKEKLRRANIGKKITEEVKQKTKRGLIKYYENPKAREYQAEKANEHHRNNKITSEIRKKLSEASKRRWAKYKEATEDI
jgi:group I intron endonuclease